MIAQMPSYPCSNPNCKSYGKPHPNCKCGSPMANGGAVVDFCSGGNIHNSNCEYFQGGGQVQVQYQDNPEDTIGHASVDNGLLGLLKNVGKPSMKEPEKHKKTLHSIKSGLKKFDHLKGHAMTGMPQSENSDAILSRLQGPIMSQEPHPEALRSSFDYLKSAIRGHGTLKNHVSKMLGKSSERMEPDSKGREALKEHLSDLEKDPSKMLEVGGSLGHYLPEHSASVASHSANAINYLNTLKPRPSQNSPLDTVTPIDKVGEGKYNRALDIAYRPLLVSQFIKDGTFTPQDLTTLQSIYPGLYKSMVSKAGEALIEAKTKDVEIPYKQKRSLSLLLGQPLDSTMTQQSMQAIMMANGGAQSPQSQPKKATGVELKQINKVDSMAETPLESRQINRKS